MSMVLHVGAKACCISFGAELCCDESSALRKLDLIGILSDFLIILANSAARISLRTILRGRQPAMMSKLVEAVVFKHPVAFRRPILWIRSSLSKVVVETVHHTG